MNSQINDAIKTLDLDSQLVLSQEAVNLIATYNDLEQTLETDEQIEQFFEALEMDIDKLSVYEEQLICEYVLGV